MSDLQHLTPRELLARIENRNRRFKVASFVFGAVLLTGLVILLVLGLDTLQKVNSQLASQKQLLNSQQQTLSAIGASGKQRTGQINDLQNHIDCIVELFRQPNRQSLTIRDLNGCQFDNNGNIITPSGGTNVPQKSTNTTTTINNNGGALTTPQSAVASQPAQSTQPASGATPKPKPLQALFCKIDLLHLACNG